MIVTVVVIAVIVLSHRISFDVLKTGRKFFSKKLVLNGVQHTRLYLSSYLWL
jgi:hypothetical protein